MAAIPITHLISPPNNRTMVHPDAALTADALILLPIRARAIVLALIALAVLVAAPATVVATLAPALTLPCVLIIPAIIRVRSPPAALLPDPDPGPDPHLGPEVYPLNPTVLQAPLLMRLMEEILPKPSHLKRKLLRAGISYHEGCPYNLLPFYYLNCLSMCGGILYS